MGRAMRRGKESSRGWVGRRLLLHRAGSALGESQTPTFCFLLGLEADTASGLYVLCSGLWGQPQPRKKIPWGNKTPLTDVETHSAAEQARHALGWASWWYSITSPFTPSPRSWWGLCTGADGLQSDLESLHTLLALGGLGQLVFTRGLSFLNKIN